MGWMNKDQIYIFQAFYYCMGKIIIICWSIREFLGTMVLEVNDWHSLNITMVRDKCNIIRVSQLVKHDTNNAFKLGKKKM